MLCSWGKNRPAITATEWITGIYFDQTMILTVRANLNNSSDFVILLFLEHTAWHLWNKFIINRPFQWNIQNKCSVLFTSWDSSIRNKSWMEIYDYRLEAVSHHTLTYTNMVAANKNSTEIRNTTITTFYTIKILNLGVRT